MEKKANRKLILDGLQLSLKQYPSDWRINIDNAVADLEVVEAEYNDDTFSAESFMSDIHLIKEQEEASSDSVKGYRLGDWRLLEQALNGDWEST